MWIDGAAQALIDDFWRLAGGPAAFPRDFARPIARALPVAIVRLPRLSLGAVEAWLSRRGAAHRFGCSDRLVRGCLVAYRGQGAVFVDGTDPETEIRFTVAHELAHFLLDYWFLRTTVAKRLGPNAVEVLDGERPPTIDERLAGVLSGVLVGPFSEFMDRDDAGEAEIAIRGLEDRADRMAATLIAPPEAVLAAARPLPADFPGRLREVVAVMECGFGLPARIARRYAWSLLMEAGCGPSLAESLRL